MHGIALQYDELSKLLLNLCSFIAVLAFLEKCFLHNQEVKTIDIDQQIYFYQFVVNYTCNQTWRWC